MAIVTGLIGALLIGATIWEVFKDLFHPSDSGAFSDWLGRWLFNLFRRKPGMLPLAGPLTMVLVIASWVLALVAGFALLYYGSFPDAFRTSTGEIPPSSPRLLTVLYFSFETLITLGYGDIVPQTMTVRFVSACEGLIGFGLLTASVSSIVLLFPALARIRRLALSVSNLVAAERTIGMSVAQSGSDAALRALAEGVTTVGVDLAHFPITYYFSATDREGSLVHWAPQLARMAAEGLSAGAPDQVRLAAAALDHALTVFAGMLAERFLHISPDDRDAVFRALAADHATNRAEVIA